MCLIKIYQTIGRFHSIFDCFEVALAVAIMKQNRHQFDQDYLKSRSRDASSFISSFVESRNTQQHPYLRNCHTLRHQEATRMLSISG